MNGRCSIHKCGVVLQPRRRWESPGQEQELLLPLNSANPLNSLLELAVARWMPSWSCCPRAVQQGDAQGTEFLPVPGHSSRDAQGPEFLPVPGHSSRGMLRGTEFLPVSRQSSRDAQGTEGHNSPLPHPALLPRDLFC